MLDAGIVRLPLEEHDSLTLEFLFREALVIMMRDGGVVQPKADCDQKEIEVRLCTGT
jgi:transcriptional antiterminator Rof (Rho-off)